MSWIEPKDADERERFAAGCRDTAGHLREEAAVLRRRADGLEREARRYEDRAAELAEATR